MRDIVGYGVLLFFCFTFYFLCFVSLQQQIVLRDANLRHFVCDSQCANAEHSRGTGDDVGLQNTHLSNAQLEKRINLNEADTKKYRNSETVSDHRDSLTFSPINKDDGSVGGKPVGLPRSRKLPRCPSVPSGLKNQVDFVIRDKITFQPVQYGGTWAPKSCKATENVAIIVPYRDRKEHLDIFLPYMHAFLQKQLLRYRIFVVEMALPTQFNRGLLANVGFLTAESTDRYSCFIFHDVDLLPLNETNLYVCSDKPRHMSVKNSKYQYRLPYGEYFGGIVAFRRHQFVTVNGFSNLYFGWGAEDDDLRRRLQVRNVSYERQEDSKAYYQALAHKGDAGNPKNPLGKHLYDTAAERLYRDGLTSVRYMRLAIEFRDLYTWVYVRANETEVMEDYPGLRSPPFTRVWPQHQSQVLNQLLAVFGGIRTNHTQ